MTTPTVSDPTVQRTVLEGIVRQRLISAVYNGTAMILAPHQLYSRGGALYLGAHNPQRKGRSDEAPRLGHFKLDGLSAVALREESFEPLPGPHDAPPRETDELILAITP